MFREFLDSYSRTCRGSRILNTLLDLLYVIIRVSPARPRGPLDRFYLLMAIFSFSYMGGLAYATIKYDALGEWIKDLLTFVLFTAYVASVIHYAILNEQRKRTEAITVKKRGGELIVYGWILLTISLTLLTAFTDLTYNSMIRTLWAIAVGSVATMMTARAMRKSANGENNHSPPAVR